MTDEQIIPAPEGENPGTEDGVGERVEQGLGSDGVRHLEDEFGDLGSEIGELGSDGRAGLAESDVAHEAPDA